MDFAIKLMPFIGTKKKSMLIQFVICFLVLSTIFQCWCGGVRSRYLVANIVSYKSLCDSKIGCEIKEMRDFNLTGR